MLSAQTFRTRSKAKGNFAMTEKNVIHNVIEAVQTRTPGCENYRVTQTQTRFLDGSLYTVAFDFTDPHTNDTRYLMNRVYVHGGQIDVFGNDEMLLSILGQTHKRSLVEKMIDSDGIAGIIALALTITICAISYRMPEATIPDILKSALSAILGFYFARATAK